MISEQRDTIAARRKSARNEKLIADYQAAIAENPAISRMELMAKLMRKHRIYSTSTYYRILKTIGQ